MKDLAIGNTNFFKFNNNLFIKFLGIAQYRVLFVPRVEARSQPPAFLWVSRALMPQANSYHMLLYNHLCLSTSQDWAPQEKKLRLIHSCIPITQHNAWSM